MEAIGRGAQGAAVEDVQRRLDELGHATDDPRGTFGPSTEAAVRRFQQTRLLIADGVVGPDTWTALVDAGFALGDRLLYLTRPPLRGDDVTQLQRTLSRLGFDTGATDGIHGRLTDAALRDFQHNIGIAEDGIAGARTLGLLESLRRRHQEATSFEVIERHGVEPPGSLVGMRIVVDPARGPGSPGHVPDEAGHLLAEHELTHDVAVRLRGMLAAHGAHPLLTRAATATPSSGDRAALANETDADVVVSIHCGAEGTDAVAGVSARYFGDDVTHSHRGRQLAELAVARVAAATGSVDCRAHASMSNLLRETRAPTTVVEIGMLTNPEEGAALQRPEHRHAIAAAILDALVAWADH